MSLTLYYAPWSSATTCLWAVEELGIPCERVKVDLAAKATQTPEFKKLNPNAKVPVLVQDGVPIFESIAILAYLGETFGVEKKLFPAPGIERAQALQWLAWANVSLGPAVSRYLSNSSDQVPAELRNAKAADAAKAEVQSLLALLDAKLEGRSWLVGETFTLADLHLAGAMAWIGRLGFDVASLENVGAWAKRCQARPAFAKVMAG
jgi:glutathione S-transferase